MRMPFAPAELEEIARPASEKARAVNEALPERTSLRPDPLLRADSAGISNRFVS
jgi:hypothetical protein